MAVAKDQMLVRNFAANLRARMQEKHFSQEQLEAETEVPRSCISEALNAKADVRGSAACRIAKALGISLDDLYATPTPMRKKVSASS